MEPVTLNQRKVICIIESNLGIEFKGFSKFDAQVFISVNMERSKQVASERSALMQEVYAADREYDNKYEYTDEDYYNDMTWYGFPT